MSAGSPAPVFQRSRQPDSAFEELEAAHRRAEERVVEDRDERDPPVPPVLAVRDRLDPGALLEGDRLEHRAVLEPRAARPASIVPGARRVPRLAQILGSQQAADDVRSHHRRRRPRRHRGLLQTLGLVSRRAYRVPKRMRDVEGRVAFITGGGSGVGLGMAKAFVAAGMRVAIADIRADHLEAATAELERRRARDPAGRDRPRGVRARRGRDRARPRERARPLQQRRDQPLQRHRRRDVPGLGLGARRQPRRRRQRRRHVRAADQGARRGRARRQHGVDGRVRRRPGRGHLHDREVRRARAVGRAALEPAAARDRRLDGLPGPRQEQDLRERPDPAARALDRRDARRRGVHAHPARAARGRDGPRRDRREGRCARSGRTTSTSSRTPTTATSCARSSTRSIAAFPDEPVPPDRLAVEEGRRAGKAQALASWPGD